MSAPDLEQIRSWLEGAPDNADNIGYALLAIAERLDTANKIAAAQVYATMGQPSYGLARAILDDVRR